MEFAAMIATRLLEYLNKEKEIPEEAIRILLAIL